MINVDYDLACIDSVINNPDWLADQNATEIIEQAGTEGIETIMWLVMRGALGDDVTCLHFHTTSLRTPVRGFCCSRRPLVVSRAPTEVMNDCDVLTCVVMATGRLIRFAGNQFVESFVHASRPDRYSSSSGDVQEVFQQPGLL